MRCQSDGCDNRLTGRQTKWCSPKCQRRQWRLDNPEKKRQMAQRWDQDNRDKRYEYTRKARLQREYGITPADYDALLEDQEGVCYICQKECPTGKRLAVDHSHTSGEVRGLLCSNCNRGLGHFQDSPDLLQNAIHYLNKN